VSSLTEKDKRRLQALKTILGVKVARLVAVAIHNITHQNFQVVETFLRRFQKKLMKYGNPPKAWRPDKRI
jgi:hypothetical protein